MNVKFSPRIHTAYNPAILEVTSEGEKSATVTVEIADEISGNATQPISLKRDFFNGKAYFDFSACLKHSFRDKVEEKSGILIDHNLFTEYNYYGEGFGSEGNIALNAVAQIGESSDYSSREGEFLTNFEKIIVYKDFPVNIAILGFNKSTAVSVGGALSTGYKDRIFTKSLNTRNYPDKILIATGAYPPVLKSKPLEHRCIPSSPFYVRWINQQGGWDYWMFSFRQTIKNSVKGQKTFKPSIFNQQTATRFIREYGKEARSLITVGAEGLSPNEFSCVSKLIFSPKIEYFDTETLKWYSLLLDKGTTENDNRLHEKTVEFTFLLPVPHIQM